MSNLKELASAFRTFKSKRQQGLTRICFAHVPKCAGSAVNNAISSQFSLTDKLLHGSFSINDKACIKAAEVFGEARREVRDRLVAYVLAEGKHKYIAGHFHCRPELVQAFGDDWHFITILRDPVERWISGYVYDRYKTAERGKVNQDVEAFIESERGQYSGMTYLAYFSNIPKDPSYKSFAPFVDEAEANLKNFSLVGTVKRMDEFATEFSKISGTPLTIKKNNTTPKETAKKDIKADAALMEKITDICRPDIDLFNRITS